MQLKTSTRMAHRSPAAAMATVIAAMRETYIAHNATVIDILKNTNVEDAPGVVAIARIPDHSGSDGINTTTDGKRPT